jgi:5-methylcytosine-specific restriction endonuclease McrA
MMAIRRSEARRRRPPPEVIDRHKARKREYNKRPEVRVRTAVWREANRDRANARRRELRRLNPERVRADALQRFHQREAAKRGVACERIDPIALFERDKWTCQLCGRPTPRETIGISPRPMNLPTIDHIIPLIDNGTHTWDNVQCACLQCNCRKKNRLISSFVSTRE